MGLRVGLGKLPEEVRALLVASLGGRGGTRKAGWWGQ